MTPGFLLFKNIRGDDDMKNATPVPRTIKVSPKTGRIGTLNIVKELLELQKGDKVELLTAVEDGQTHVILRKAQ